MLLTPAAPYAVMPVTRLKPGKLQSPICRSEKKLDEVAKVAEVEKTRATILVV
jgi:hypothetical protein